MRLSAFITIALALHALPCIAAAQDAALARLDSLYQRSASTWQVPGFAIAIVRNDSVIFARGYGVREAGKPAAVTAETPFYTGSITKAFTTAAIGLLAESGKLRASGPVSEHLPAFAPGNAHPFKDLTFIDLLAHRTAVPRADMLLMSGFADSAVVRRISALQPAPALRGRMAYSNQMYQVLGEAIRVLSGQSYSEYVETQLLSPIGMRNSNARGSAFTSSESARPHGMIDGRVAVLEPLSREPYGAGAVNASAADMARWMRVILNNGTIDGKRIVSEGIVQAMRTAHVVASPMTLTPGAVMLSAGLGGFVHDYRGRLVYLNAGQAEGSTAAAAMLPSERIGVVVLTNLHGSLLPQALIPTTLDVLLGERPRDWIALLQRAEASQRAQVLRSDRALAVGLGFAGPALQLAGEYEHPIHGAVTITQSGATATLSYGRMLRGELSRTAADRYRVRWAPTAARAALGDSRLVVEGAGASTVITLEVAGERIAFRRR